MRIVAALGGNALLKRGEPLEARVQRHNVNLAAETIAKLAVEHEIVITHGNGPQVGLLALEAEAYGDVAPYPLDILGAESQGMIGYLLLESLGNHLPSRSLASVVTRVYVDESDRAFAHPSKPVGPAYEGEVAERLARDRNWTIARDGDLYRRVVPSPEPRDVLDLQVIRLLVDAGLTVICGGGGGVPMAGVNGRRLGVEGVVDKDLTSLLIALGLKADMLILLTDVEGVFRGWGTPSAELIRVARPRQLRGEDFDAGSMGPKVEAACRFVEAGAGTAAIGALEMAPEIVAGTAGTAIVP